MNERRERLMANIDRINEIINEIPGRCGNEARAVLNEILAEFKDMQNKLIACEAERIQVNEQIGKFAKLLKEQQDLNYRMHHMMLSWEELLNERDEGGTADANPS